MSNNSSSITFSYIDSTISEEQKIINAISYLKSFTNPKAIIDDKNAYEAIFLILLMKESYTDLILNSNCEKLFGDILLELHKHARLPDNNNESLNFTNFTITYETISANNVCTNDRRISLIAFILQLVNYFVKKSIKFNVDFASQNGLKAHLAFIKDDAMLAKITNVELRMIHYKMKIYHNFVFLLITNIGALSRCYERNRQLWWNEDAMEVLLKIVKINPLTELSVYLAVCNIASDNQIETLPEIDKVVCTLCEILIGCAQDFRADQDRLNRKKNQIMDGDQFIDSEVHCFKCEDNTTVAVTSILNALYKLAVNGKAKTAIYFDHGIKDHLSVFLTKGNEIEQRFTLKLLSHLTLDSPRVCLNLNANKEIVSCLNSKGSQINGYIKSNILLNMKNSVLTESDNAGLPGYDNRIYNNRYETLHRVGGGQFGQVYKVKDHHEENSS